MPEYSVLGLDLDMLSVGPLFKGIKMIPPGPHFVYYSPVSRHGPNQPFITGFFINPKPADVIVRRWGPHSELLIKISDPDEEERYQNSVRNLMLFDRHLGPYNLQHYHIWKRLTSCISSEVIERLEPVAGNISVMHEAEFADRLPQTTAERQLNQRLAEQREFLLNKKIATEVLAMKKAVCGSTVLDKSYEGNVHAITSTRADSLSNEHVNVDENTEMDVERSSDSSPKFGKAQVDTEENFGVNTSGQQASGRCFYTRLPQLVRRRGISGPELTMLNVDKSAELEHLLEKQYGGYENGLLGELQFSFIAFLMGQSLESFSQWKSIVCLMLSCDEAPLSKRTKLFVRFLEVVCFQLQTGLRGSGLSNMDAAFADSLMDNSWFSEDTLLQSRFREFHQLVVETHPVDGDLLKQTRKLKVILESAVGWNFVNRDGDMGDDEYAPVIVPERELSSFC
ncbi:hypothetical protein KP509_38G034000 [Ceratopteris richardii]|nr:hypothetical protein KP509_38G034000 [Ceratopteris richardii]